MKKLITVLLGTCVFFSSVVWAGKDITKMWVYNQVLIPTVLIVSKPRSIDLDTEILWVWFKDTLKVGKTPLKAFVIDIHDDAAALRIDGGNSVSSGFFQANESLSVIVISVASGLLQSQTRSEIVSSFPATRSKCAEEFDVHSSCLSHVLWHEMCHARRAMLGRPHSESSADRCANGTIGWAKKKGTALVNSSHRNTKRLKPVKTVAPINWWHAKLVRNGDIEP